MAANTPQGNGARAATLLAIAIAVPLLYLSLRGVSWEEVWQSLRQANPLLLLVACLTLTGSYLIRSWRWRILLRSRCGVGFATVFWATTVGYLGNTFLPARAGDLLRPFAIGDRDGATKSFVLATVITERIAEVALLTSVSLVLVGQSGLTPPWLGGAAQAMALLSLAGVAALLTAPLFMPLLLAFARRIPWLQPAVARLERPVQQLSLGMRTLHHPPRLLGFVTLTVVIWMLEMAYTVAVARALALSLSPLEGLLLLAALSLASALPSTPGYIGVFQFVAVTVMVPFGFTQAQAIVYILVFQAVQLVTVLVLGGLGVWRLSGGTRPSLRHLLDRAATEQAGE